MLGVSHDERVAVDRIVRGLVWRGISDRVWARGDISLVDIALVSVVLGACPSRLLLDNWKSEGFETMYRLVSEIDPLSVVSHYWAFITFGRSFPGVPEQSRPAIYGYVKRDELGEFCAAIEALPMGWRARLERDMRLLLASMHRAIVDSLQAKLDLFALID
jgi:hypothetical protein